MASRVNVRFVVTLSAVLMLVAVVAVGAAYFVLNKTGADYAQAARAAIEAGEFERAESLAARAAAHDNANVEWLDLYAETIRLNVPTTQAQYGEKIEQLRAIWRQRAQALATDLDAHHKYLGSIWELTQIQRRPGRANYEFLSDETDRTLLNFPSAPGPQDTLRRYRAMYGARVINTLNEDDQALIDEVNADIEAVLAQDPADARVALSKAKLGLAKQTTDPEAFEAAHQYLTDYYAAHPDKPSVGLLALNVDAFLARAEAFQGLTKIEDRLAALDEINEQFGPRLEALADQVVELGTDPEDTLWIERIQLVQTAEGTVHPTGDFGVSRRTLERLIEADPTQMKSLLALADLQRRNDELEAALATYERVRDAENLPVSMRGVRRFSDRLQAADLLIETSAALWSRAPEGSPEKAAALARTEGYLDDLRSRVDPGSPQLLKNEGRLALMKGDLGTARTKLQEYQSIAGADELDVTRMLGEVTMRQGQFGAAREHFRRLVEAEPGNTSAKIQLAAVEAELRNYEQAQLLLGMVPEGDPNYAAAEEMLKRIDIALGVTKADDPVTQALLDATRTLQGDAVTPGDVGGAIDILQRAAVELGQPPRLVTQLVQILTSSGRKDEAIAALETAIEANPDDEGLRNIQLLLTSDDTLAVGLEMINQSDQPEWRKALQRAQLYRSDFQDDACRAELDKALELEPENAEVVEAAFVVSIMDGDMERAGRLADTAQAINADRAQGLTYRARILLREGDAERAAQVLTEAASANPNNPKIFNLLANTRILLGQSEQAADAYRRALELQPDDVAILVDYIRGMTRLGQYDEALRIARANERFGRGSPAYEDLRIGLEAEQGNLDYAVKAREQLAQDYPKDMDNLAALAALYLSSARWAEARSTIDRLLEQDTSARAIQLSARWYVDQGDPQGALTAFQDYILQLDPDRVTAEPYLAFGGFMVDRGQVQLGLTAMLEARDFQSPEKMEAERSLAEAYFRLARPVEAMDALKRGVENATDPEAVATMRKRLVETLILNGDDEQARGYLAQFTEQEFTDDPDLRLFQAQLVANSGNRAEARRLFDQLVAENPRSSTMYLARARFNRDDPLLLSDAEADATRAIELDPQRYQGYTLRAEIRRDRGDTEGFLLDIQSAALAAPDRPDLRNIALNELLAAGRPGVAAEFARKVADERPGDVMIVATFAELFGRSGEWTRSKEMYDLAWERRPMPELVGGYVIALLEQRRPDVDRARELFAELGTETVTASPALLISRARVEAASGDFESAGQDATSAYLLLGDSPQDQLGWYGAVRDAFGDDREMERYLVRAEGRFEDPSWPALFRGELLGGQEATRQRGVDLLETLSAQAESPVVRRLASRMIGTVYSTAGQPAQAVAAWQSHLERYPDDWSAANNIAYVMVTELNDAAGARPYAEKAIEMQPDSADTQDTLGMVLAALGENEAAEAAFRRGMVVVLERSPTSVGLRVHLAALLAQMGQAEEAAALLNEAERQMTIVPAGSSYQSQIDELRAVMSGTD